MTSRRTTSPKRKPSTKRTTSPKRKPSTKRTTSPKRKTSTKRTTSPKRKPSTKRTTSPKRKPSTKRTTSPKRKPSTKRTTSPKGMLDIFRKKDKVSDCKDKVKKIKSEEKWKQNVTKFKELINMFPNYKSFKCNREIHAACLVYLTEDSKFRSEGEFLEFSEIIKNALEDKRFVPKPLPELTIKLVEEFLDWQSSGEGEETLNKEKFKVGRVQRRPRGSVCKVNSDCTDADNECINNSCTYVDSKRRLKEYTFCTLAYIINKLIDIYYYRRDRSIRKTQDFISESHFDSRYALPEKYRLPGRHGGYLLATSRPRR